MIRARCLHCKHCAYPQLQQLKLWITSPAAARWRAIGYLRAPVIQIATRNPPTSLSREKIRIHLHLILASRSVERHLGARLKTQRHTEGRTLGTETLRNRVCLIERNSSVAALPAHNQNATRPTERSLGEQRSYPLRQPLTLWITRPNPNRYTFRRLF